MLMMVDPDVHFHVLPRYAQSRSFAGREFAIMAGQAHQILRALTTRTEKQIAAYSLV